MLSLRNKHPFDERIRFQEKGHKYWIDNNNENIISATTYIHTFFAEFEEQKIIENIQKKEEYTTDPDYKYYQMTKEQIKNVWEEARNSGTSLHKDIENYLNGEEYNDSPEFQFFLTFIKDHPTWSIYRTEWLIFAEILKLTGSIDAVFKNEKDEFIIVDWKRINVLNYIGFGNGKFPFEHLPDSNFYHYSLQLNLYRNILERCYKIKIKDMYLVLLHDTNPNYNKIQVKRMEKEADYLFDFRLKQLKKIGFVHEKVNDLFIEHKIPFDETIAKLKFKPKEGSKEIILTKKQKEVYKHLKEGKNVFVTGEAGTGKTAIIKKYVNDFRHHRTIAITATTGTAAILLNGTTLFSYLGIGLAEETADVLFIKLKKKPYFIKRWKELDTLIIDEISMLRPELFDKLELLARSIRKINKVFGGIQLFLCGDFFQLPNIGEPDRFCFDANTWYKCIDYTIYLDENFRQDDVVFQNCLSKIRYGTVDDETEKILKARENVVLRNSFGILPTKIYSLNINVDMENEKEMDILFEKNNKLIFYSFELKKTILKKTTNIDEKIKKSCSASTELQLCVGAQVMLLYNLDIDEKLVNGSRGIITSFQNDLPIVKFLTGQTRLIDYYTWNIEENGEVLVKIEQIPLKLAYACSVHRSQGLTIDYAEVDLEGIFEYGQAYVALSRVRSLDGLSIRHWNATCIKSHPRVIEYYDNLNI
jgi:ATP-dependent DNA helicase PIF1